MFGLASGEKEGHYAIITTDCAKDISWLHERMPVILDTDEKIDMWLNPENTPETLLKILRPLEGLEWYGTKHFFQLGVDTNTLSVMKYRR